MTGDVGCQNSFSNQLSDFHRTRTRTDDVQRRVVLEDLEKFRYMHFLQNGLILSNESQFSLPPHFEGVIGSG